MDTVNFGVKRVTRGLLNTHYQREDSILTPFNVTPSLTANGSKESFNDNFDNGLSKSTNQKSPITLNQPLFLLNRDERSGEREQLQSKLKPINEIKQFSIKVSPSNKNQNPLGSSSTNKSNPYKFSFNINPQTSQIQFITENRSPHDQECSDFYSLSESLTSKNLKRQIDPFKSQIKHFKIPGNSVFSSRNDTQEIGSIFLKNTKNSDNKHDLLNKFESVHINPLDLKGIKQKIDQSYDDITGSQYKSSNRNENRYNNQSHKRGDSNSSIHSQRIKSIIKKNKNQVSGGFQPYNRDYKNVVNAMNIENQQERSRSLMKERPINSANNLLPQIKKLTENLSMNPSNISLFEDPQMISYTVDQNPKIHMKNIQVQKKQSPRNDSYLDDAEPNQEFEEFMKKTFMFLKVSQSQELSLLKPSLFLSIVDATMKHPIFCKLSEEFIRELLQRCSFTFLNQNQILFKEEDETLICFIPLYGQLGIWSKRKGALGRIITGWTVGEEALVDKNFICRIENCHAETETALLSIDKNQWQEIKDRVIGRSSMVKDLNMLETILRRNFFIKKHWRNGGGVKKVYFNRKSNYDLNLIEEQQYQYQQ